MSSGGRAPSLRSRVNSVLGLPPRSAGTPAAPATLPFPAAHRPSLPPLPCFGAHSSVSRSGYWLLEGYESGDWLSLDVAQVPSRKWSEVTASWRDSGTAGR